METLRSLTKSELIQVVEKLSSSVGDAKVAQAIAACGKQPTAGVARAAVSAPPLKKARVQKVRKSAKPFDMSKYSQRHIALQVGYFGENYFGLAAQEHLQETVEHHLFQALCKTRLVTDRASSNYSRYANACMLCMHDRMVKVWTHGQRCERLRASSVHSSSVPQAIAWTRYGCKR